MKFSNILGLSYEMQCMHAVETAVPTCFFKLIIIEQMNLPCQKINDSQFLSITVRGEMI